MKRLDIINWDEYFMGLAHLSALRSKDPNTQVGACIVDKNNRVISIGYNGLPTGCDDDVFPWTKEGSMFDSKYAYVVHAELNAILNAKVPLNDTTIYVSLFPCNECAKAIIQSGITKVVYESDKYAHSEAVLASKRMFKAAKVQCVQLDYQIKISVEKIKNDL